MMQLAMYKGPATELVHKIGHWATCLVTGSRYSHVELVIYGVCFSSSIRDGGVRSKVIALDSGHWDLVDLTGIYATRQARAAALEWFRLHDGENYDWRGCARFVLPFIPHGSRQWFCSEAIAQALGIPNAASYSPQGLLEHVSPAHAVRPFKSSQFSGK